MRYKVKSCDTVGYAYMVVQISPFGREKVMQRGLTELEARSLANRLRTR